MRGFYFLLGFSLSVIVPFLVKPEDTPKPVYIVYMGATLHPNGSQRTDHAELLQTLRKRNNGCVLHTYYKSFLGLAAHLSKEEAKSIEEMRGVVSVFPDSVLQLRTTHSWDFLQNQQVAFRTINNTTTTTTISPASYTSNFSSDTIIGVIDTGIWPEAPSFRAPPNMGPIPPRWKGKCLGGKNFKCSKKVIGARYYGDDVTSAFDEVGHGTHTASIAAGMPVAGASYYGLAMGTARGGSPYSRIAVYQVCGVTDCPNSSVLKAFDDAIADGVDVISISLANSDGNNNFLTNTIYLGAFHATLRQILVVSGAGNGGPSRKTVENYAPWILTVGATTIDRDLEVDIVLDYGRKVIKGGGLNFCSLNNKSYPLFDAASVANKIGDPNLRYNVSHCASNLLNHHQVNGKIVVCENDDYWFGPKQKFESLKSQGAIGMITIDDYYSRVMSPYGTYPIASVSTADGAQIRKYMKSNRKTLATILSTATVINIKPAPVVFYQSSRGPPHDISNLIKPDVVAPGVNILAAWPPLDDDRKINGRAYSDFALDTGTSMSCPHVSGLAALVKSKNPTWNSSAIKSAIMTTAIYTNNSHYPITTDKGSIATPYDMGSGEISLTASLQPGLVYETGTADYIQFLCNMGYNTSTIQTMASNYIPHDFSCPCDSHPDLISNMNYPSIAVSGLKAGGKPKTVQRTVTNVGEPNSIYTVSIDAPLGLEVEVEPNKLQFTTSNKQNFKVTFKINTSSAGKKDLFGSITWVSSKHKVRSPFAVSIT